ncbi:serine hydrolase domain-containing protein [Labrys neptuniae]
MLDQLTNWLEKTGAPAVSLAIDDGHKLHCFNKGVSDLRTQAAVGEETAFQLGSVSKVVTAFALLEALAARGLSVDTPVIAIAPDLKASNEHAFHDVTVRHLLCHTSGLDSQWWVDFGRGDCARRMAARAIASTPLLARPGELFSYSGPGLILAGYLTEALSGVSWEDYVRATCAKYLGDHSISARPEDILLRPSATGYVSRSKEGHGPVAAARWYAPLALSPGGGLVGTTADLARLMRAVRERLQIGLDQANGPVGQVVATIGWRYAGWGLGMARYWLSDGSLCWGHDGTTSGQAYAIRLCARRSETVVVATNAVWAASDLGKLAEAIMETRLGVSDRSFARTSQDALTGYDAWRLPPDQDITGTYVRLNSTMLVQPKSNEELVVDEVFSPQDEANWFGGKAPNGTDRVSDTVRRIGQHSYASTSKEFHFLRHPDDPARIYVHNGMRATVKTHRPWI